MTQADPRNLYREGKAVADRLQMCIRDSFSMAGNYVWIIVKFSLVMVLISHTVQLCGGVYEVFLWEMCIRDSLMGIARVRLARGFADARARFRARAYMRK